MLAYLLLVMRFADAGGAVGGWRTCGDPHQCYHLLAHDRAARTWSWWPFCWSPLDACASRSTGFLQPLSVLREAPWFSSSMLFLLIYDVVVSCSVVPMCPSSSMESWCDALHPLLLRFWSRLRQLVLVALAFELFLQEF